MTNKTLNQSNNGISSYIKDVEAAKRLERTKSGGRADALRSDRLPGSQLTPANKFVTGKNILKRNIYLCITLFILGMIWYGSLGPGRLFLEEKLNTLANKKTVQAAQTNLESVVIVNASSNPTETTKPSSTSTSIYTQVPEVVNPPQPLSSPTLPILHTATNTPDVTATSTPDCYAATDITLADVGKILCVQGVIIKTKANPTNFMVIFGVESGSFYWVTYDMVWSYGEVGNCYRTTGKIERISNSPVLVFNYANLPMECR